MSRTGKKPVVLPEKVTVTKSDSGLSVKGPLGTLQVPVNPLVRIEATPKEVTVARSEETRDARRIQGLIRSLLSNAVSGVSQGFKKTLEIEGIGYRAELKGNDLHLLAGFSHPILFPIPQGIKIGVEKQVRVTVTGFDKCLVGQVAANIRKLKVPEPYKGKGIRYEGEVIQRKVGKAAATAGGGGAK